MTNPYDSLRHELVQASTRLDAAGAPRPRWRRWLRHRPAVLGAAAVIVCGSAAAATVSLTASPSQHLTGNVPGALPARPRVPTQSLAGYRYTVTVTPFLAAGSVGWSSGITYVDPRTNQLDSGMSGGGGYPTAGNPIFQASGFIAFGSGGRRERSPRQVMYVLTGPDVAAVRVGKQTVRTFSSPSLPAGDRAAVFFIPAHGAGEGIGHGGPAGVAVIAFGNPPVRPIALDATGAVIRQRPFLPAGSSYSFWQAPAAVTPNNRQAPYHGPSRPARGACELSQHGLRGLIPAFGATIRSISPATDAVGEVLLSCVNTTYYLHGWPIGAAVLLNGRHPGAPPGPIPGATPVPGHAGIVNDQAANVTARRAGNAWLIVNSGIGETERLAALNAITISRLDLSHISHTPAPH